MKPMVVLDASVLLSGLPPVNQSQIDYADSVLAQIGKVQFVAPFLLSYEVTSVLLKAARSKRISHKTARAQLDALSHLGLRWYDTFFEPTQLYELAKSSHLQGYDAVYFGLAKTLNASIATIDQGIRNSCKTHGITLFQPL